MRSLEGADNGNVAHDDHKEGDEDDANNQDGERYRGGLRGGDGACSCEVKIGQSEILSLDLLEFSSHPARPQTLVAVARFFI